MAPRKRAATFGRAYYERRVWRVIMRFSVAKPRSRWGIDRYIAAIADCPDFWGRETRGDGHAR